MLLGTIPKTESVRTLEFQYKTITKIMALELKPKVAAIPKFIIKTKGEFLNYYFTS